MRYAIDSNNTIKKAHETYEPFNADDRIRWACEAREKAVRDYNTLLNGAKAEGEAKKKGNRRESEKDGALD